MKQIYIIEHLEKKVWKWCLIEYENISKIVGKNNLWFTNIKRRNKNLEKLGRVFKKRVSELNLEQACVLDPEAFKLLNPKEAKRFKYFIFGGILGDYPRKKRTKKELTKFIRFPGRNIGKKQMSTDNAVFTVKQIASGKKFSSLRFKDNLEIRVNDIESVILPFRYNLSKGKPFISEKLVKLLKRKKGF